MTYEPYSESELHILLHEPWEVTDRPYRLHAAYALYCLYEAAMPEPDDEDEEQDIEDMFGRTIPKKILDRLVKDISDSFNDAAENGNKVDIGNRRYSIRKVNAYDRKRLCQIFSFPLSNDEYTITRDGIINLYATLPELKKYDVGKEEFADNKSYLRKVILMAEDDDNDGWDKLTDMEIAMYCWAQYYNKFQFENILDFQNRYKDYLYVSQQEMEGCMTDKSRLRGKPYGMYAFSASGIRQWNTEAGQESLIDSISDEDADNYWYDTALKHTFKPIDMKKGD